MLAGARNAPPGLRLVRDEPERIVLAHEEPFRIGDAEFHPATRELTFNGETSIVEPRVMQALVALHRADGAVVSKDDLASLCWDGRIVGEDAINRVISRLRAIAEKHAGGAFRVETITKVGYRLVATNGQLSSGDKPTLDQPSTQRRTHRREFLIGGAALGAVALTGIGWKAFNRDSTPAETRALLDGARGWLCEANIEQAGNSVAQVRRAVQLSPNNAEAWGLLAFAYARYAHAAPGDQRSDLRARGEVAMRKAFALEPNQPDALAAQLWSTPIYRNWYNFEKGARSALRLHPENPVLAFTLALGLYEVGRIQESLPLYEKMLATYPIVPGNHVGHAFALWDLGRLDDAESAISRAFELFPRNSSVWFTRFYYLMYNGRAGEAAAMHSDLDGRPAGIPDWDFDLSQMQVAAVMSGDRQQVRKTIEAWDKAAERGTGFTTNGAIFAAFVGDLDESFRLLNALYFNRGIKMADTYFTKEQGIYSGGDRHTYDLFRRPIAPIRRDPRFAELTRELGLDDYWRRTNSRSLVIA